LHHAGLLFNPEDVGNMFLQNADFQQTTWHYIPEDRTLQEHLIQNVINISLPKHTHSLKTSSVKDMMLNAQTQHSKWKLRGVSSNCFKYAEGEIISTYLGANVGRQNQIQDKTTNHLAVSSTSADTPEKNIQFTKKSEKGKYIFHYFAYIITGMNVNLLNMQLMMHFFSWLCTTFMYMSI
jgi:hypothetical protein